MNMAEYGLVEPRLFSTPLGSMVRHNWFRDLAFEKEIDAVVLSRCSQLRETC